MRKPSTIDAIIALVPDAQVVVSGETSETLGEIKWINYETPPVTNDEIEEEYEKLIIEYVNKDYQRKRANEYPELKEQFDQLYHDMKNGLLGISATTGSWYVGITSVKSQYPKT